MAIGNQPMHDMLADESAAAGDGHPDLHSYATQ